MDSRENSKFKSKIILLVGMLTLVLIGIIVTTILVTTMGNHENDRFSHSVSQDILTSTISVEKNMNTPVGTSVLTLSNNASSIWSMESQSISHTLPSVQDPLVVESTINANITTSSDDILILNPMNNVTLSAALDKMSTILNTTSQIG